MRRHLQLISIVVLLSFGCKAQIEKYRIHSDHYILSRNDNPTKDTTQLDRILLQAIIRTLQPTENQKILLVNDSSQKKTLAEYGMYDYSKKKLYYSLSKNDQHYFTDIVTSESNRYKELLRPLINDSHASFNDVKKFVSSEKNIIVNLIEFQIDKELILISVYKW
jgi:hypothetical protein